MRKTLILTLAAVLAGAPVLDARAQDFPTGASPEGIRGKKPPPRRGGGPPPGAPGAAPGGEFNAAAFTCLEYSNAMGENSTTRLQGVIARIWIEGNMAGLGRARDRLELGTAQADRDAMTALISETCANRPTASIQSVSVMDQGKSELKIPNEVIRGFDLDRYTCGDHLAARKAGAGAAVTADLAEMWAFAFIQGYKLAARPDLIIPAQNKPVLVGAVLKACAGRPAGTLLDTTAQVAEKVKIQ